MSPTPSDQREAGGGVQADAPEPRGLGRGLWRAVRRPEAAVYIGFVAVFVYFAVTLHDVGFLSGRNFITIIQQTTPISVMAVAMVLVLATAEIDLSIGSVVALSALVTATQVNEHGAVLGALAGLATGVVAGVLNGVLVVSLRVPSFLITLGTLALFAGLAELITKLQDVPVRNISYTTLFGSGAFLGIPVAALWTVAAVVVGHLVLRHTAFGQRVLATGDNRVSARAVGINTDRVRLAVLAISGAGAALAGMIYVGEIHGAVHTLGGNDMLTVLAAVVIGGTSLFGGRGSMVGALIGSVILGVISNGLILAGLSASQQRVVTGVIIVVAVAVSQRQAKETIS